MCVKITHFYLLPAEQLFRPKCALSGASLSHSLVLLSSAQILSHSVCLFCILLSHINSVHNIHYHTKTFVLIQPGLVGSLSPPLLAPFVHRIDNGRGKHKRIQRIPRAWTLFLMLPLLPISSFSSFFSLSSLFQNPFYPHSSRPSLASIATLRSFYLHLLSFESYLNATNNPNFCALSTHPPNPPILSFTLASHPPYHSDDPCQKLESATAFGGGGAQSHHPVQFRILHPSLFQTEPRSGPQVTLNTTNPPAQRSP